MIYLLNRSIECFLFVWELNYCKMEQKILIINDVAFYSEGYFPSYNVPFFEIIYNMSGYPQMVKQFGSANEYQLAPRAKIFRRDAGAVNDLESMKAIMRYNGE